MPLSQLHRVRWAVRATLALGVAASVVANVLHARDNPISQAIAAWPPLALLLTVELISRVPVHRRALAVARMAATATITGIAAWVSYWHMVGVAARYGETGASPYLLPLSVDGLIVVASICLVELSGRIAVEQRHSVPDPGVAATTVPKGSPAGAAHAAGGGAPAGNGTPTGNGTGDSAGSGAANAVGSNTGSNTASPNGHRGPNGFGSGTGLGATTVGALELAREAATAAGMPVATRAKPEATAARATATARTTAAARTTTVAGAPGAAAGSGTANAKPGPAAKSAARRPRRPVAETAALAAAIAADRPHATDDDVAQELGITPARLRAVRRQARELELAA